MEYGQPCSVGSELSWKPGPAAVTSLTSCSSFPTAAVVPWSPGLYSPKQKGHLKLRETGALNSPNQQEVDNLKQNQHEFSLE